MELFPKNSIDIFRSRMRKKLEREDSLEPSDSYFLDTIVSSCFTSTSLVLILRKKGEQALLNSRNTKDTIQSTKSKLQQWESFIKTKDKTLESNETAYKREMEETLDQLQNFLHRLEVLAKINTKRRKGLSKNWEKMQEFDHFFKDQIQLGLTLRANAKKLLDLENEGARLSRSVKKALTHKSSSTFGSCYTKDSQEPLAPRIDQTSNYSTEIKNVLNKFDRILKIGELLPWTEVLFQKNSVTQSSSIKSKSGTSQLLSQPERRLKLTDL